MSTPTYVEGRKEAQSTYDRDMASVYSEWDFTKQWVSKDVKLRPGGCRVERKVRHVTVTPFA
jgi:hypothetical protein